MLSSIDTALTRLPAVADAVATLSSTLSTLSTLSNTVSIADTLSHTVSGLALAASATYAPNGRVFTWLALVVWLQLAVYVVIFLMWMRLTYRNACRETRLRGAPLAGADAREYLGTLLILGVLAAAALSGCFAIGRYLLQALWGAGA